ncbi:MAG: efflux RND transporter periplasmic adaptor subunit [Proteobacteria bacterium]|nr:efflux RND transporter periplasmic adaptor subunit [Pseudomonadota bacterium]
MRFLLLTIFAVVLTGCASQASPEKSATVTPVSVTVVTQEDIADEIAYVADLSAWAEVQLYSPVSDRILYFPWEEGDKVSEGDVVARIRSEGLDAAISQINAQVEALDVQLAAQNADLARTAELLRAGVVTERTWEQAQASYQSSLAQRRSTAASRDQIQVNAGNAVVTAPMAGIVANRSLEVGDMATPQQQLCAILQVDTIRIELDLVEADVSRVHVGQSVKLEVDAWPGRTFEGQLVRLLPYIDPTTRTNTAVVRIDNSVDETTGLRPLKPGMYGMARLVVSEKPDALVAPAQALLLDTEVLAGQQPGQTLRKAWVVMPDGTAQSRLVHVGARVGDRWEVLSGIEVGEEVIVRGQHGLSEGERVRIAISS